MDAIFAPLLDTDPTLTGWAAVVLVIGLAFALGTFVSFAYRWATPAATSSIGIQHTLIYLALIVALVMLIISNEVARAFTLVGALAVIRFRTPVKDSRDAAFIFLSLAAGMGAGVGMFVETALGVTLIGLLMIAVRGLRIGMRPRGETVVKLTVSASDGGPDPYPRRTFETYLRHARLLSTRSGPDGDRLELTYVVQPKREADLPAFSRDLSGHAGVLQAMVIVADDDGLFGNVF